MQIERPHPKIGALVTGVDVRSLSDDQWKTLYRTWLDSVVMVVRNQTLTKEEFLAYSRRFGRLKPHRVKKTRDPEHAELACAFERIDGKVLLFVPLRQVRLDLALGKIAHHLLDLQLFVGKTEVHA